MESVTQGGAVTGTNGASPVRVTLSAPLAGNSALPELHPSTPGTWAKTGSTLTFTPATPFWPGSRVRVTLPGGGSGLRSAAGGLLAKTVTQRISTQGWSTLRLKQMLAQLGYLPLKWAPQNPTAMQPDNVATELAAMYTPPAGSFTWKKGYPSILTSFWGGRSSLIMQGAIRAFQSDAGVTMTGVMTPALWRDVVAAAAVGKKNPHGYTYALASKASPETLTVWHNGRVILHTLANTGIPAAPTADGTFPVYLRYTFQIMSGTNPDGSHYADPVSWVSYFDGGDAVHYFPRGFYGAPQSLGCVELPYAQAHYVWPYMTYGTLVTVDRPPRGPHTAVRPPGRDPAGAAGVISRRGYGCASIASEPGALAPPADLSREPTVSAQQLHITLAGREHVVDAGTTAGDALRLSEPAPRPGPGTRSSRRGSMASCATWPPRWPTVTPSSRSRSAATTAGPSCGTPPRT